MQLDSSVFNGMLIYYWVGLAVATISTLAVYFITHSRIGLALRAIREDEISAASHGINVLKYKVISFMIGSFMAGVAGSIYAYYLFDVKPPDVFKMNWLFYPILIVVLGGTGTVFGPVMGAFIVSALFAYGNVYFSGYQTVFSGLLIILVMLFMPDGIMGSRRCRRCGTRRLPSPRAPNRPNEESGSGEERRMTDPRPLPASAARSQKEGLDGHEGRH